MTNISNVFYRFPEIRYIICSNRGKTTAINRQTKSMKFYSNLKINQDLSQHAYCITRHVSLFLNKTAYAQGNCACVEYCESSPVGERFAHSNMRTKTHMYAKSAIRLSFLIPKKISLN